MTSHGAGEARPDDRLREAIQTFSVGIAGLLRRVAPRNDVESTHVSILAAQSARALHRLALIKNRGRREGRLAAAPGAAAQRNLRERAMTTGTGGDNRPSLRDGFTAYTNSPR